MGKLYFCISTARAGKSTYCNEWVRFFGSLVDYNKKDFPITPRTLVRGDDIRLSLGHRYNSLTEPLVSATKKIMIRTLLKEFDVINDATNTTEASIRSLLEIDIMAQPILFKTPLEVCKERAIKTNQPDLLPVIDRQYQQLQKLLEEGFDKVMERLRSEVSQYYREKIVD